MTNPYRKVLACVFAGLYLSFGLACSRSENNASSRAEDSSTAHDSKTNDARNGQVPTPENQNQEPKSAEAKSVDPEVQAEIERLEAQRRVSLLADAVLALDATRTALTALDQGDKNTALASLERASGKLDLVLSRDPNLGLAPVEVSTTVLDLYASPDTVKAAVKDAKDDLASNRVQQARHLVGDLASEADTRVIGIPLATYPAAIKAVAPLIDSGKIEQAKTSLDAALHTLVTITYIVPLPGIRAQALLQKAEQLSSENNRTPDAKAKARSYVDATLTQLRLAETLGYGTKDDFKPLYAQLDDLQKKVESGQQGRGAFAKLEQTLKNFKFSSRS